jgi:hypothetical protein
VNGFYFVLRYYLTRSLFWDTHDLISNLESIFVLVVLFGLQVYSYFGILDHASNNASKKQDSTLVGGSYLDLLALALIIQFGAILISSKFYYVLAIVAPIWGANNLMNTASLFQPPPPGGGPGAFAAPSTQPNSSSTTRSAYQQHLAQAERNKKM